MQDATDKEATKTGSHKVASSGQSVTRAQVLTHRTIPTTLLTTNNATIQGTQGMQKSWAGRAEGGDGGLWRGGVCASHPSFTLHPSNCTLDGHVFLTSALQAADSQIHVRTNMTCREGASHMTHSAPRPISRRKLTTYMKYSRRVNSFMRTKTASRSHCRRTACSTPGATQSVQRTVGLLTRTAGTVQRMCDPDPRT